MNCVVDIPTADLNLDIVMPATLHVTLANW